MKTVLFSPCYLDGFDDQGNKRLDRTIRFVDYYLNLKKELGFDKLKLLDNGSSLSSQVKIRSKDIEFQSLENLEHHKRTPHHYPHCWRALYHIKDLIKEGYEKIIMIDNDGFILSRRLLEYISNLENNWTCFYSNRGKFCDTSLSILCKDSFHVYEEFTKRPYEQYLGSFMELLVPFNFIERGFNCERYGELNNYAGIPISDEHDYYGQAGPHIIPRLK